MPAISTSRGDRLASLDWLRFLVVLSLAPFHAAMATTRQTAIPPCIISASQRRAEILIAALFLVTAAVSIPAALVLDPMLDAADYLARLFPSKAAVELTALLWSINNVGIVFIAVFAFGLLRKLDEALAVGYLASGSSKAPS
jgi:hypothetical protein